MLHLIFQLSETGAAVLERIDAGDAAVFIGQSALRLLNRGYLADSLAGAAKTRYLCVLGDDLEALGIGCEELVEGVEVIDYAGLVDLTVKHRQSQSWF